MTDRIVCACSGGVGSEAAIRTLVRRCGGEVVALTLDIGQDRELGEVRDRMLEAGAARAHVLDARDEFAREFVLPALRAGALRDGWDPMAEPLAYALIGRKLVDVAAIEDADSIAYGGAGLDAMQIDHTVLTLNPDLRRVHVPREPDTSVVHDGRREQAPHVVRTNLWGRVIDYNGADTLPESLYAWTKSPATAPPDGAQVEIAFECGVPTAVNGVPLALTELIESVSIIAGRHGVGRIPSDVQSSGRRRALELPGATVLHAAHLALTTTVVPPDLARLRTECARAYAECIWNGSWFTTLRDALDAFNAVVQTRVTGAVRMRFFKGQQTIVSHESPGASGEQPVAAAHRSLAAHAPGPHA
jgi:argininosuccinate synthase